MNSVTVSEAQARLPDLLQQLNPGEEVLIVQAGETVGKLTRQSLRAIPCKAGSARDTKHWMAADFDAPLDDFAEYME